MTEQSWMRCRDPLLLINTTDESDVPRASWPACVCVSVRFHSRVCMFVCVHLNLLLDEAIARSPGLQTIPSGSKLIGAATLRLCSDNDHKHCGCSRMTDPALPTHSLLCPSLNPLPPPTPEHTYTGQCRGKSGEKGVGGGREW